MLSNNTSSNPDSDSSSGNPDSTFVNVPDINSPISFEEPESPGELVVPVPINGLSIDTRPRILPSVPSSSNSSHVTRIFSKTYVYPDWVTKKHYKFFRRLQKRLLKLKYIHSNAATYFDKLNFYIFAPSITITAISSIGSFLSTASFIAEDTQNIFGISVGVLASGSAMLQSLASACKYNVKAESHRAAADEYDRLLTRLQFEMEMPNEENFMDDFEKEILDVQNKCKYFPPQFIIDRYPGESDGEILPSNNRVTGTETESSA
jgi:hypothetical protein